MRLKVEQLSYHLEKTLLPIYLISGEEFLLVEEARILLLKAAQKNEFDNREKFTIEKGFDWQKIITAQKNRSLFGNKTVLELHLSSLKLDATGKEMLNSLCTTPNKDKLIILTCGKLDATAQKANWIQALDVSGAIIQIWPIESKNLPLWVLSRLKQNGLDADLTTAKFIAEATEGNLLASAQEVLKLKLLYGTKKIGIDDVTFAVSGNTNFNVFNLVDYALEGNYAKVTAIMSDLKKDGMEPILILWALAREIRTLLKLKTLQNKKEPLERAFFKLQVWPKRQPLVTKALKKHSEENLIQMLAAAAKIDEMLKGVTPGQVWLELLKLAIRL